MYYGGEMLKVQVKKIFNWNIAVHLKEGVLYPVYKEKGKDFVQMKNYCGITLSSDYKLILLHCLFPIFEETDFPDISQTACQRGQSCAHTIYAAQEALLTRQRRWNQYICFYDVEKAFDSTELPILLKQLFVIGIKAICGTFTSRGTHTLLELNNCLSVPLHIGCSVMQGSVVSPTLFCDHDGLPT